VTHDVWWRFTPSQTGLYEVRAIGHRISLVLGVYTGSCGALQEVATVNAPSPYFGEHLVLNLQAGT
jgi:hypothetical protein